MMQLRSNNAGADREARGPALGLPTGGRLTLHAASGVAAGRST